MPDYTDRLIGSFIHETSYVDENTKIGTGTKIWHFCHLLQGTVIGKNCSLGQNVVIGPNVCVGDRVKIQNNVSIYSGVTIASDVFCGPSCVFTNVINPRSQVERKDEYKPTLVGKGASIGANATIICGNSIGEYAFIAAGATVTKPVAAFSLVVGVPAVHTGWMSKAGCRLTGDLVCPIDGTKYIEIDGKLCELTV